jgi:hypothetical protein
MSFASSSLAHAQNIPARSPPAAAIGRENDMSVGYAFFASGQTSW